MIIAGTSAHAVQTLLDSKKGSLTNRLDCAKEHAKNDIKTGVQIGLPTVAVAGAAIAKPSLLSKLAVATGGALGKFASILGKCIKKIAPKAGAKASSALAKAAGFLGKNAYKAGVVGLVAAGALYVLNKVVNHAEQKGRIDQKYEDAAAIECHTKNIVLQA